MALQNDRGRLLIARCAGVKEDDIMRLVLNVTKAVLRCKADTVVADLFRVIGPVGDAADRFKIPEYPVWLQTGQNCHKEGCRLSEKW